MQLTVGQLARRSGLTVRTLHHFDQIGLLRPGARSAAGYRLYGEHDQARLQAILALRALGLPLQQVAALLDETGPGPGGGSGALPMVLARQVQALDAQIAEASALRSRLALLLDRAAAGGTPDPAAWLDGLTAMAAYARHFSADELRGLLGRWQVVQAEWAPLQAAVRAAMDGGLAATDLAAQPLAQQWMGLIHHWLGGDFALIERWGRMYLGEASARRHGGPDLAMVRWIEQATTPRLAAWQRHFSLAELSRFGHLPSSAWRALDDLSAAERDTRLQAQLLTLVGEDAALLARLRQALAAEPLLRAGLALPAGLLQRWLEAAALSPSGAAHSGPVRPPKAARSATPSHRTSPG